MADGPDDATVLSLSLVQDEIKKLTRRIDTLQKSVDLLMQDRSILEDMQGSIRALQEVLLHNRQHVDTTMKDVKQEVKDSQEKTESQIQEMKEVVDSGVSVLVKEIVKPNVNRSLWQRIKQLYPFNRKVVKKS